MNSLSKIDNKRFPGVIFVPIPFEFRIPIKGDFFWCINCYQIEHCVIPNLDKPYWIYDMTCPECDVILKQPKHWCSALDDRYPGYGETIAHI